MKGFCAAIDSVQFSSKSELSFAIFRQFEFSVLFEYSSQLLSSWCSSWFSGSSGPSWSFLVPLGPSVSCVVLFWFSFALRFGFLVLFGSFGFLWFFGLLGFFGSFGFLGFFLVSWGLSGFRGPPLVHKVYYSQRFGNICFWKEKKKVLPKWLKATNISHPL